MSPRQSPTPRKKPMFDRRFLWLMIFILIPLIPFLNSLGPSEGFMVTPRDEPAQEQFDPDTLQIQKAELNGVPATWAHLPNSQLVRISVLSDRQPLARPSPPQSAQLTVEARHGYYLATVTMPLRTAALEAGVRFLDLWLPAPNGRTRYAISGELTPQRVAEIGTALGRADAPGVTFAPQVPAAVTRLRSPLPGTQAYEAFVIAMDLLRRRVDGYNPRLRWDHAERHSHALMNISLSPTERGVPEPDDFQAALARRKAALNVEALTAGQVHNRLITLAAYDLSVDTRQARQDHLSTLDYETFVTLWEDWFGPSQ